MNDHAFYTGLIPLKMCSAVLTLDQYHSGWTLAQIEADNTPSPRRFDYYVKFDDRFSNVPLVHTGIIGFDMDNRDSNRISIRASEITSDGFKLSTQTWMHTRVYMIEVSWLALGHA